MLESRDRGSDWKPRVDRIDELAEDKQLELVSKMVHFFRPQTGFHLIAHSEAPAGAGISGSSALAIALIGALNRLVGNRYDETEFIGDCREYRNDSHQGSGRHPGLLSGVLRFGLVYSLAS